MNMLLWKVFGGEQWSQECVTGPWGAPPTAPMHTPARVPSPEGDSVQQTRVQKPLQLQLAVPSGPFCGFAPDWGCCRAPG